MEQIKYRLTNEFFVIILAAFALAIIDIALYMAFPINLQILLIIAGVMIIIALKYIAAFLTTYIVLNTNHLKVREYGPLSLTFKHIPHSQLHSIILIGQTLTIYYDSKKSIEVELGDMSAASALLLAEYLQSLGHEIRKPGDGKLKIVPENTQLQNRLEQNTDI